VNDYLAKFSTAVGPTQSQQILRILNRKKDQGIIRSASDFAEELGTLTRELTSTRITPTFHLLTSSDGDAISAAKHNEMLERADDDLTTAFNEANQVDYLQRIHSGLLKDVVLKNLKAGIAELEDTISTFELLANNQHGFSSAIGSSFKSLRSVKLPRSIDANVSLYLDLHGTELPNASVDLTGERLTLPDIERNFVDGVIVRRVYNEESPSSLVSVNPATSKLSNMADGAAGTYWIEDILTDSDESVTVQYGFKFQSYRDIDTIHIEPALAKEIHFDKITYRKFDGTWKTVTIDSPIADNSIEVFKTINTNEVVVHFSSVNAVPTSFQYDLESYTLLEQSVMEPPGGFEPNIDNVITSLVDILSSEKVIQLAGGVIPDGNIIDFHGYSHVFGIDNIKFGQIKYGKDGIYASPSLEGNDFQLFGVHTTESRPYRNGSDVLHTSDTYNPSHDRDFIGSIEYNVIRRVFDSNGHVIEQIASPTLPVGVTFVSKERLVPDEKTDSSMNFFNVATTRFMATPDAPIKVFNNGVEITQGSGWDIISTVADETPDSGTRMTTRIQLSSNGPNDFWTCSYYPLISTTFAKPADDYQVTSASGSIVSDLVGDLSARLVPGTTVLMDHATGSKVTTNLSIVLRRNTNLLQYSPAVLDFHLSAGQKEGIDG